jgi:hypothetical protein
VQRRATEVLIDLLLGHLLGWHSKRVEWVEGSSIGGAGSGNVVPIFWPHSMDIFKFHHGVSK